MLIKITELRYKQAAFARIRVSDFFFKRSPTEIPGFKFSHSYIAYRTDTILLSRNDGVFRGLKLV